jgi:hypothetical protein
MALSPILEKMLIGRAFASEPGRIKLYGKMDWMLFPARDPALKKNKRFIDETNYAVKTRWTKKKDN